MELPKELETMLVTPDDLDYEAQMNILVEDMMESVMQNIDVDKELEDVDLSDDEKEMVVACFSDGFKEGYKACALMIRECLLKEKK